MITVPDIYKEPKDLALGVVSLRDHPGGVDALQRSRQMGVRKLRLVRQLQLPDWLLAHITLPQLEDLAQQAQQLRTQGTPFRLVLNCREEGTEGHRQMVEAHVQIEPLLQA